MKIKLLFILGFCPLIFLSAQINPKTKWGDVSQAEIDYKEVSFEKDAGAIILYEEGNLELNHLLYEKKIYKRIKILDETGLAYANQELMFYSHESLESIKGIRAQTINHENGVKIVSEVDKKSIFEVDVNEYYKAFRFTFPNVKVGSIIELEYSLIDKKIYFIDAWEFQHEIPTIYSKFNFKNDSYIDFRSISIGEKLVKLTNKRHEPSEWVLGDIPSLKKLNYVYNKADIAERLVFQIQGYLANTHLINQNTKYVDGIGSWANLVKEKEKEYKDMSSASAVNNLPIGAKNPNDELGSLNEVVRYFNSQFKWNHFTAISPRIGNRSLIDSKNGNVADLNLLLNTILIEKGFDAKLALISTRDYGKIITSYPYLGQFNALINFVKLKNGSTYFLDASDLSSGLGFAPLRNNNHYGLIVDSREEQFISITPLLSEFFSTQNYIYSDGKFTLSRVDKSTGYFNTEAKNLVTNVKFSLDLNLIEKSKTQSTLIDEKYLGTKTTFQSPIENQSFYAVQNPLANIIGKYQFSELTRERPLEFDFPFYYKIATVIKIPTGYTVEIPQNFNVKHEIGKNELIYYQNVEVKDDILVYSIEFLMGKSIFTNQFPDVKRFFDKINLAAAQSILLKRK